jgi:hypothetical protein
VLTSGEALAKHDVFAVQPRTEETLRAFLTELRSRPLGRFAPVRRWRRSTTRRSLQ